MSLTRDDGEALEALACFLLRHERWDEAQQVLEGLTAARPEDAYAWYGLALIAERRDEPERAAELYAACRARSNRPEYALSHAVCLIRLRRPAQAKTALGTIGATAPTKLRQRARALLAALDGPRQ